MNYSLYTKPHKSPSDLVNSLKAKNLFFDDVTNAEKTLTNINYHRLKAYLYPLMDHTTSQYTAGTKFEDALALYRFDDELRDILFSIIGRIEVKLRSRLDQVVTTFTNNSFWYLDDQWFKDNGYSIQNTREALSNAFSRSKDDLATHYKEKYYNDTNNNYKQLPPFWMISEFFTFGHLVAFYKQLDHSKFEVPSPRHNKLDDLAKEFGARKFSILISWLNLIKEIRNRCAHHSRVWNSNYRAPGGINAPSHVNKNRLYAFFIVLHKVEQQMSLGINIKQLLVDLISRYPIVERYYTSAGFHEAWEHDDFW